MHEVESEVISLIAAQLPVEPQRITRDAHLVKDLGADSLAIVSLVLEVEEHWQLDLPDEDVEELETVGQLAEYVALALSDRESIGTSPRSQWAGTPRP